MRLAPGHKHVHFSEYRLCKTGRRVQTMPRSGAPDQQQQGSPAPAGLNEDMLAQLRAAQEEAARLKKQLEEVQSQRVRS